MKRKYTRPELLSFSVAMALICFVGCEFSPTSKRVGFSCASWNYDATIRGTNAIIVTDSTLSFQGQAVPQGLINAGFTFHTPLGVFSPYKANLIPHATKPQWWTAAYSPPCKLKCLVDGTSEISEKHLDKGIYRIDSSIDQNGDFERLPTRHLKTPEYWIFLELHDGGYWIDPLKLGTLSEKVPSGRDRL